MAIIITSRLYHDGRRRFILLSTQKMFHLMVIYVINCVNLLNIMKSRFWNKKCIHQQHNYAITYFNLQKCLKTVRESV